MCACVWAKPLRLRGNIPEHRRKRLRLSFVWLNKNESKKIECHGCIWRDDKRQEAHYYKLQPKQCTNNKFNNVHL